MAYHNTVLLQLLEFVPGHEFETLSNRHHSGRSFRTASRLSQFVTMVIAPLSGRNSLRDYIVNISVQTNRLYHPGSARLTCSSLLRTHEDKPCALGEALFEKIPGRFQELTPGHDFRFNKPLYSLAVRYLD